MEQALRNRRSAYLYGLCFVALAVAVSLLTAPHPDEVHPTTTLTAIFLVYALGSVGILYAVFLRPDQAIGLADRQEPRPSLGRMAWMLSGIGVAGMIGPVVLGVLLYQLSAEAWRMVLLGGIGLLGGLVTYVRIGEDLRRLLDHGLASWDPFGPPAD
jgi:MFS family permease